MAQFVILTAKSFNVGKSIQCWDHLLVRLQPSYRAKPWTDSGHLTKCFHYTSKQCYRQNTSLFRTSLLSLSELFIENRILYVVFSDSVANSRDKQCWMLINKTSLGLSLIVFNRKEESLLITFIVCVWGCASNQAAYLSWNCILFCQNK